MYKISFTGDLVCDKPLLAAAEKEGSYNFEDVFRNLKELFSQSEYVVGALETTFSGREAGYNSRSFAYNSPDALAAAMRSSGINVMTTANNHCMDYGVEGIRRTISTLHKLGFLHTGTAEDEKKYIILKCGSVKIAVLSYTAVMNSKLDARNFSMEEKKAVNLLAEINPQLSLKLMIKKLMPLFLRHYLTQQYYSFKKRNHVPTIREQIDNEEITAKDEAYISEFINQAGSARKEADIVFVCVHSGGQFNQLPGRKSRTLLQRISPYVDGIIANHPHVIQEIICREGNHVTAYSLGTLNLSLSADYIYFDNLPQYSMVLHFYIDEKSKTISKISFSLLRAEEDKKAYIRVYPVTLFCDLFPEKRREVQIDIDTLCSTIYGRHVENMDIWSEYPLLGGDTCE